MTAELISLVGRVRQVARDCEALAGAADDMTRAAAGADCDQPNGIEGYNDQALELVALRILRLRRERERLFGAALFADPAWDMLLDLFAQRGCAKPISVSSLAIAAYVPPTTALRYIDLLEERGLVSRRPAPCDGRVRYIELTEAACIRLRALLTKALQTDGNISCGQRPASPVTQS